MGIALYIAAGFSAGIISGMGMGGGVILIPVLTLLLGMEQKAAGAINLLYFIPTGAVALWVHIKNRNIKTKIALPVAIFAAAGAIGGALLAGVVSSHILRKIFAVFTIFVGISEICVAVKKEK